MSTIHSNSVWRIHSLSRQAVGRILIKTFIVCLFAFSVGMALFSSSHIDFGFFYYSFQSVLHHQTNMMYDFIAEQQWMRAHGFPTAPNSQYVYPPLFAAVWSWLGRIPLRVAWVWWAILSITSYVISVALIARAVLSSSSGWRTYAFIFIAASFTPYLWDLLIQNDNWLVLFLVALGIYFHIGRKRAIAGVLFGLAALFKVTPIILLLYFGLRRKWQMVIGGIISILLGVLITVFWLGTKVLVAYITLFKSLVTRSMQYGGAPYNSSLRGLILWWNKSHHDMGIHYVHLVWVVYLILLTLTIIWASRQHLLDESYHTAVASLSVLLYSPLTEIPHMVLTLPAVAYLLTSRKSHITFKFPMVSTEQELFPLAKCVLYWVMFTVLAIALSLCGWILLKQMPWEYGLVLVVLTAMVMTRK